MDTINARHADAAKGYGVNVADTTAFAALGKQIAGDFGRIDILVNNAGITRDGLCMRMKESDWDTVLDVNLKGAFNGVKAFQKPLLKSKAGRIINITSIIGLTGNAGQVNYAASKAGLIGFTKSVAREFGKRAITANAIAPGFIATDMTDALTEDQKNAILEKIPLGDLGNVADIESMTAFLASDEARYVTGQVLTVDGGMAM